jgi:NDP-sugar pyrophosphorylase family protein
VIFLSEFRIQNSELFTSAAEPDDMSSIAEIPVALLAGGIATRLRPVTQSIPKCLVPVAGRPFIDHQLDLLKRAGIRRIVLCLGHLGQSVQAHVGDGIRLGMDVRYSFDGEKLLGTGGALRRALPLLGELFWVMYGDSYMDIDYRAILTAFDAHPQALGLMTVLRNNGRWDRSNVLFQDGRLVRYDKRTPTPDMQHIDYGVALLRRPALDRISDGPADLADLYSSLVADGRMIGYEVTTRFYEIGTPASLAEADEHLSQKAEGRSEIRRGDRQK